jgi:hypothetical protein
MFASAPSLEVQWQEYEARIRGFAELFVACNLSVLKYNDDRYRDGFDYFGDDRREWFKRELTQFLIDTKLERSFGLISTCGGTFEDGMEYSYFICDKSRKFRFGYPKTKSA